MYLVGAHTILSRLYLLVCICNYLWSSSWQQSRQFCMKNKNDIQQNPELHIYGIPAFTIAQVSRCSILYLVNFECNSKRYTFIVDIVVFQLRNLKQRHLLAGSGVSWLVLSYLFGGMSVENSSISVSAKSTAFIPLVQRRLSQYMQFS